MFAKKNSTPIPAEGVIEAGGTTPTQEVIHVGDGHDSGASQAGTDGAGGQAVDEDIGWVERGSGDAQTNLKIGL
jgi:hypothetical protein